MPGSGAYINEQEFVDNVAKRLPVCIVVDCSGSMRERDENNLRRIDKVNSGIRQFYEEIRKDPKAKKSVEVLVIQVGNDATVLQDFASTEGVPPQLSYLHEKCNLSAGVRLALEKLDERKKVYNGVHVGYYQPWLMVMSDGGVMNPRYIVLEQQKIREREKNEKLTVFPVFVQEEPHWESSLMKYVPIKPETYNERRFIMSRFSNDANKLITIDVKNSVSFENFFRFLHRSASSLSNGKGIINDAQYGSHGSQTKISDNPSVSDIAVETYEEEEPVDLTPEDDSVDDWTETESALESEQAEIERLKQAARAYREPETSEEQHINTRRSYEMYQNGDRIYPNRSLEDDKYILVVKLPDNAKVRITKNGRTVIYECELLSGGTYRFTIDADDKVTEVVRTEQKPTVAEREKQLSDKKQEIERLISTISDWDKI